MKIKNNTLSTHFDRWKLLKKLQKCRLPTANVSFNSNLNTSQAVDISLSWYKQIAIET